MTAAQMNAMFLAAGCYGAKAMTVEEKARAFDVLATALTNRWHDGAWSANCTSLVDQPSRPTRAACVPDLLAWAERIAAANLRRCGEPLS